jgi:2-phosphosulfolactate phosphatase
MQEAEKKIGAEVCLTPGLFGDILAEGECIVVLADILRATTSICYAFMNGVSSVIPVSTLEEAEQMKKMGFLVASEQDGKKLDFADFGNSAFSFTRERVEGKTLVYCTTNGTRALDVARKRAPVAIGSFSNITALKEWLVGQQLPVVILCSGWKNKFCLEDTLFAGALAEMLLEEPGYHTLCDAAHASMDLFRIARTDLVGYVSKAMHRERLRSLGLDDVIPYSFEYDHTDVVPVFNGKEIINMNKSFVL